MSKKGLSVEQLAYQIWEDQGRPHGQDAAHWLQAEQRLSAGSGNKARKAAALVTPSDTKKAAKTKSDVKSKKKKKA